MKYVLQAGRNWDDLLVRGRLRWLEPVLLVLLALYTLAVACIVLWPTHVDAGRGGQNLRRFLISGRAEGWLPEWLSYALVEWLANVAMFIPGALLLTLLLRGNLRCWVPAVAILATCLIEGIQLLLPGRTSSVLDIAANSLGGLVGWLVGIIVIICATVRFFPYHRSAEGMKTD